MNSIEVSSMTFSWAQEKALLFDNVSFAIKQGESCFIQGKSGIGKTTLLGILAGLNQPLSGQVDLLGENLYQMKSGYRDQYRAHHIGFIFQMFNLIPYLSIAENIKLSCTFSETRRKKAVEKSGSVELEIKRLLDALELNEKGLEKATVNTLSVGQQQRVAAARALIGAPEIVIADEPTSALDDSVQARFIQLLLEECADNEQTVLFVSHDARLQTQFDQVLRLEELIVPNRLNNDKSHVSQELD